MTETVDARAALLTVYVAVGLVAMFLAQVIVTALDFYKHASPEERTHAHLTWAGAVLLWPVVACIIVLRILFLGVRAVGRWFAWITSTSTTPDLPEAPASTVESEPATPTHDEGPYRGGNTCPTCGQPRS